MSINIAIDGPAGAGKSTIARRIAKELSFIYVDTGAMYRAMAIHLLRMGTPMEDQAAIEANCQSAEISIAYEQGEQQVLLGGENVTALLRTEEVGNMASVSSANPVVREKLLDLPVEGEKEEGLTDRSLLDVEDIWDFVNTVEIDDIRAVISRQIEYNTAIAKEGLRGDYGANIGSVLLSAYGDDVKNRAKAMAAAGSDARMNGCELPVIINAGSGNQGMTCSLPVLEYAKELRSGEDQLYRALALSNLVAIHQKTGIGRLSAYCGAVSAGAAAGAGIAYLCGGGYGEVIHTVVNALAIVSGMVCDGAKASCAAKIASAVDAGILGYHMYLNGQQFYAGDGIVTKGIEGTITNIGRLGKEGMKETNEEIIKMMIEE